MSYKIIFSRVDAHINVEYGDLYTWGRGFEGQLGHGDRDNSAVPRAVEKLAHERIVRAHCGHAHTLALTGI